jgi:beta-phosphoglucomutase-like phosphatase (HAD superfamily)
MLTNSRPTAVNAHLAFAGIANMFEMSLSVDAVSKFKPHRAAYDMAARRLDVVPADIMLVAAHNWDTSGAIAAGWQAAFVARPGMMLGPLDATQQIVGGDMTEVVDQILGERTAQTRAIERASRRSVCESCAPDLARGCQRVKLSVTPNAAVGINQVPGCGDIGCS